MQWLVDTFDVGLKDFCVYWFRKTQNHLEPGQRAGLVGTNSIAQNRARSASLQYLVDEGSVITDAISSQKWPGEAKVHVALVNWIKDPSTAPILRVLDGATVQAIGPDLKPERDQVVPVLVLPANQDHVFYGPVPIGKGFILTEAAAAKMRKAKVANAEVVRPFLTGSDIVEDPAQQARRWCIDFGLRTFQEASHYVQPLSHVRDYVKPERDTNRRPAYRKRWWLFGEPCREMRGAISPLPRHIVGLSTGKRPAFTWSDLSTSMNNSTVVFALSEDYHMGILTSHLHGAWAWARASTLETRLRYTPSSVFETFPWPDPVTAQRRAAVADAARALLARRLEIWGQEQFGLTQLYNQVDEGGWTDMVALHRALDEAVTVCYKWPKSIAQNSDELVRRLEKLNQAIIAGRPYTPF